MLRLLLIILLFIASLVNFFPVPAKQVWYVGIAVPEYPWIFLIVCLVLTGLSFSGKKYKTPSVVLGVITFGILLSPVIRAYSIGKSLDKKLNASFGDVSGDLKGFYQKQPFSFMQMFTGNGAKKIAFKTYTYSTVNGMELTLNFYSAAVAGMQPCLLEVHGGSWKHGDNSEIAHFNEYVANAGYHVASINYRLAPRYHSPAQQEDIHNALAWLRAHSADLKIDTGKFLLSGRSAGAQLVLTAAYSGKEQGIRGVAAFYGPTDMFWTWEHPDNKFIMDSKDVQKDFLGGTPQEKKDAYLAESPLLNANSSNSIPALLVHGKNDAHVYYTQSVRMAAKLDSLKVPNFLLGLPWATHGCEYNLNGPSGQLSMYAVCRFFKAVTK